MEIANHVSTSISPAPHRHLHLPSTPLLSPTSPTDNNPGRAYYSSRGCTFFRWADLLLVCPGCKKGYCYAWEQEDGVLYKTAALRSSCPKSKFSRTFHTLFWICRKSWKSNHSDPFIITILQKNEDQQLIAEDMNPKFLQRFCLEMPIGYDAAASSFIHEEEDDESEIIFMVLRTQEWYADDIWYIDSGCNNHMTGHKELFTNMDTDLKKEVRTGDGKILGEQEIREITVNTKKGRKGLKGIV
ncbi:unnamed protein product [Lactuca saligna]|uniref:Retrovirus-related Pol polyprotein from transposon TNT 1-94-like beta-barrel domain-containing protein n=1 Tax=Lactuca saligna TaxID=75948 RepID=A0AA35Z955_LACSI|nr:unnamed protein product [Lactuca saligna]